MMFSLNIVDYSMSFLLLSTWVFFARQVGGIILYLSCSLTFYTGPFRHAQKLWGGVGWCGGVVAHEILVSAKGPLVLGFGVWGLGVWGLGLTINKMKNFRLSHNSEPERWRLYEKFKNTTDFLCWAPVGAQQMCAWEDIMFYICIQELFYSLTTHWNETK